MKVVYLRMCWSNGGSTKYEAMQARPYVNVTVTRTRPAVTPVVCTAKKPLDPIFAGDENVIAPAGSAVTFAIWLPRGGSTCSCAERMSVAMV